LKKLHKLIIRSYLGPFIMTFFITLFIFVMQFLWKYIDELVGKGLEWYLVAELLFYASANLVPMALPLAILLASIMTFGSFGEHYELVAMKSSGMGLMRIMYPLMIVTLLTSMGAFLFTNYIWPKSNLEFASLLYDIRHKKPAFDITDGVYYDGIDGYVIRVGDKAEDGQGLKDVLIYDHTQKRGNVHVIRADSGRMEMMEDNNYLVFTLYNGSSYEEVDSKEPQDRPHTLSSFEEEVLRFDLSGFQMERSDKDIFKDNYQMLNLKQLDQAIDTYNIRIEQRAEEFSQMLVRKTLPTQIDSTSAAKMVSDSAKAVAFTSFLANHKVQLLENAISQLRSNKNFARNKMDMIASFDRSLNRHKIEWHRKFTLSFACIILFFIGAPLGAIIRKGGLGLPVVISVLFFLVYHITSMTFERLAKQNEIEPKVGMWVATTVLLPVGLFLTYKASTDSSLLDMEFYNKSVDKLLSILRLKKDKKTPSKAR
jgi:lipopolysaccharide export system permease protein